MDEDNLETLESSLGTEETSKYRFVCSCFFPLVSTRVSFSLFIFHYESIFRQSDCTLQNLYIFSGNVYIAWTYTCIWSGRKFQAIEFNSRPSVYLQVVKLLNEIRISVKLFSHSEQRHIAILTVEHINTKIMFFCLAI